MILLSVDARRPSLAAATASSPLADTRIVILQRRKSVKPKSVRAYLSPVPVLAQRRRRHPTALFKAWRYLKKRPLTSPRNSLRTESLRGDFTGRNVASKGESVRRSSRGSAGRRGPTSSRAVRGGARGVLPLVPGEACAAASSPALLNLITAPLALVPFRGPDCSAARPASSALLRPPLRLARWSPAALRLWPPSPARSSIAPPLRRPAVRPRGCGAFNECNSGPFESRPHRRNALHSLAQGYECVRHYSRSLLLAASFLFPPTAPTTRHGPGCLLLSAEAALRWHSRSLVGLYACAMELMCLVPRRVSWRFELTETGKKKSRVNMRARAFHP